MRKRIRPVLSLLLALVMAAGLLPVSARAQALPTSGSCGESAAWQFQDGTLTVQGSGRMNAYPDNSPDNFINLAPWGCYASEIRRVILSEGITSVGGWCFSQCTRLTQVSLPQSLTEIGAGAFMHCESLPSISIPQSVESIRSDAFQFCTSLEEITLPGRLTALGARAFWGCSGLRTVQLPPTLTKLEDNVFGKCTALRTIHLPGSIQDLGYTAFGGSGLTSLEVPRGVTEISGTFAACRFLTSVTLPETVTAINAFSFDGCTALPSLTLPERVNTVGEYAFRNCTALTEITFRGNAPAISSSAFSGCTLTAYYPAEKNWPREALQNYGGHITWVPYSTTPALPVLTGTWESDFVFPASDLGVQANDIVFRCKLTFASDNTVTAHWTSIDLSAIREYFHGLFVNAYYACAYGAGFTTFESVEEFCLSSTGMNVRDYMYSFLDSFNMSQLFTPAPASGICSYNSDHTAFFTTLPLMARHSDSTVPNPFTRSGDTLSFQASSYGLPETTVACRICP